MLGPLEVRDGAGLPREVSGTRLRALLELLAATPTRATLVDTLAADLGAVLAPGADGTGTRTAR
jgi:hypothetical protein